MARAPPPHCPSLQPAPASKWGLVAERLLDLATGFSDVITRVQVLVRRLLELHVFKLVALYTVWMALKEVSVDKLAYPRGPPGAMGGARGLWGGR